MKTADRRNRRSSTRRALRVECQVVRERDFALVGTQALDVSMDGMLVRTEARVLTGEGVIVSFREPRSGRYVDAAATVARVVHGRRRGDPERAIALRFVGLDDDARAVLAAGLTGVPPVFPRATVTSLRA